MADTKITALTAITTVDPAADVLPIVDVSDTSMAASGTTKKITSNQILGSGGTATLASATITGDLTVDTNVLKVDSANDYVGIGTASPVQSLTISGEASVRVNDLIYWNGYYSAGFKARAAGYAAYIGEATSGDFVIANTASSAAGAGSSLSFLERYRINNSGVHTWENVGGVAGTAMTLNSTGLGVGSTPAAPYRILSAKTSGGGQLALTTGAAAGSNASPLNIDLDFLGFTNETRARIRSTDQTSDTGNGFLSFWTQNSGTFTEKMRLSTEGNVGIGITPSAWATTTTVWRALDLQYSCGLASSGAGSGEIDLLWNAYYDQTDQRWEFKYTGDRASRYAIGGSGVHAWYNTASTGTANGAITWTQAMTLDASGNLLVGTTSGSNSRVVKAVAAGTTVLEVTGAAGYGSYFQSGDAQGSSSALSIANIGKVVSTGRSINAGGTINASGADYAEYMTKASDFVLAKGDIAGIDTNGKLTNVFADAVSFVVKSTDPSYVGNDKWGVDLEGDALEAARQLVDRIAFAGQVPVNVTGAKAGDYIVPVVDGTGIKGIAVSNPTFEQYQLAVGKVIAIDADGRARIIVKVA